MSDEDIEQLQKIQEYVVTNYGQETWDAFENSLYKTSARINYAYWGRMLGENSPTKSAERCKRLLREIRVMFLTD